MFEMMNTKPTEEQIQEQADIAADGERRGG